MLLPVVTYESVAVGEVFWEGWERAYLLDQGIRFSKWIAQVKRFVIWVVVTIGVKAGVVMHQQTLETLVETVETVDIVDIIVI